MTVFFTIFRMLKTYSKVTSIGLILLFSAHATADQTQSVPHKMAGNIFMGMEYGNRDIEMKTDFLRQIAGAVTEHSGFDNSYTSSGKSLFAGYTLPFDPLYISGRLILDVHSDEFKLSAGSSRFVNDLRYSWGLDLMPGIYLHPKLSLFGKAGIGLGNFRFIKESPTSTTYKVKDNLMSYTLGLGLACEISRFLTIKIGFDRIKYDEIEIMAERTPLLDKTVVKPNAESYYAGLQYNFQ